MGRSGEPHVSDDLSAEALAKEEACFDGRTMANG